MEHVEGPDDEADRRPSPGGVVERARERVARAGTRLNLATILAARDADRR